MYDAMDDAGRISDQAVIIETATTALRAYADGLERDAGDLPNRLYAVAVIVERAAGRIRELTRAIDDGLVKGESHETA